MACYSSSTRSHRARTFAKRNAIGAILLSLAGNATFHLINSGLLPITWHVVMAVGAVPPVILGLVSHLAVLRRHVDPEYEPAPKAEVEVVLPPAEAPVLRTAAEPAQARPGDGKPKPPPVSRRAPSAAPSRPRYGSDEVLLAAARAASAGYLAEHGKPISRDQLRRELRIGGERATAVLRRLRAEAEGA
jgi:hypothetical protein